MLRPIIMFSGAANFVTLGTTYLKRASGAWNLTLVSNNVKILITPYCIVTIVTIILAKGKARYSWHLYYGSLVCKKLNNVFNIKSSWSKLVSTRRSTVLSLPLQLVFPGLSYKLFLWELLLGILSRASYLWVRLGLIQGRLLALHWTRSDLFETGK